MKKHHRLIEKLPLDCWCETITFFSSSRDFRSVVLVVKGLLEYIEHVFPKATRSIVFRMYSLPKSEKRYVSTIEYKPEKGFDFSSDGSKKTVGDMMEIMIKLFPNVVEIGGEIVHYDHKNISRNIFSGVSTIPRSLEVLSIVIPSCESADDKSGELMNVEFPLFPKLKELTLLLAGFMEKKLKILNWNNLPSLVGLDLYAWVLCDDFFADDFKKRLRFLDLREVENVTTIEGLQNLESLTIEGEDTISSLACVRNLNRLVFLKISCNDENWEGIDLKFSIENFPELKEIDLKIQSTNVRFKGNAKNTMFLRNLPKLETVNFSGKVRESITHVPAFLPVVCSFPVRICSPSVQIIDVRKWGNVVDLVNAGCGTNLLEVSYDSCLLPENVMKALSKNRRNLKELYAHGYDYLTITRMSHRILAIPIRSTRRNRISDHPLARTFNELRMIPAPDIEGYIVGRLFTISAHFQD